VTLRVHLIVTQSTPPGAGLHCLTACGRRGFKSIRTPEPRGEWQAMERLGGLRAVTARDFEPDRHACKTCAEAWGAGAGL
jgi:hypothetical protein